MSATSLTCDRDGTATALSCAKCGTPICPRCAIRTEVGLRCPACTVAVSVPLRRHRRWPAFVGVLSLFAVIALFLLIRSGGREAPASLDSVNQSTTEFRTLTRQNLGYAVDIPVGWSPAPDNTPTTTSYTDSPPTLGALRVSIGQDPSTLADHTTRLIAVLRQQGGLDFVQTPIQISGLAAIRLDYLFPSTVVPGSPMSTHSSYIVKRDSLSVVSFQLSTEDPTAQKQVFSRIAASFRIL